MSTLFIRSALPTRELCALREADISCRVSLTDSIVFYCTYLLCLKDIGIGITMMFVFLVFLNLTRQDYFSLPLHPKFLYRVNDFQFFSLHCILKLSIVDNFNRFAVESGII